MLLLLKTGLSCVGSLSCVGISLCLCFLMHSVYQTLFQNFLTMVNFTSRKNGYLMAIVQLDFHGKMLNCAHRPAL